MENLPDVSRKSIEEFQAHSEEFIHKAVQESMAFKNEIEHHGEDAHRMIKSGLEWTYKMLKSAISAGEPKLLEDQAKWTISRLPHDEVSLVNLINRLKRMRRSMQQVLSEQTSEEITPYLDYLIAEINRGTHSD